MASIFTELKNILVDIFFLLTELVDEKLTLTQMFPKQASQILYKALVTISDSEVLFLLGVYVSALKMSYFLM